MLLGGGRALLMQVAHPLVARGVAEHSTYRRGRIDRLLRTLRPMYAIAFGSDEQAEAAARGVRQAHRSVTGEGYRADDPALMQWVLATLIDTGLHMYRTFRGPLSEARARAYYRDMRHLGEALGMGADAMPPTLVAFDQYVEGMVETLEVSSQARTIAAELFAPLPEAPWLSPAMPLMRVLTAGLLPPRLRAAYGLSWDPARAAALDVAGRASRWLLPRVPAPLRAPPRLVMPASPYGTTVPDSRYRPLQQVPPLTAGIVPSPRPRCGARPRS